MSQALKGYLVNNGRMTNVFVFVLVVSVLMTLHQVFWSSEEDGTSMGSSAWRRGGLLVNTEGCQIWSVEADPRSIFYVMDNASECHKEDGKPLVLPGNDPRAPSLRLALTSGGASYGGNVTCAYETLERSSDFNTQVGPKPPTIVNATETPVKDEFVNVYCATEKGKLVFRDMFAYIQRKEAVEERCRKWKEREDPEVDDSDKLSVLFLVIDSVSRGHYLRQMKKTNRYLKDHVTLVDMQGFTKVGKNTFPVLTAMLTGNFWQHWRTMLNLTSSSYVDAMPFIWKEFADRGYRVLYSEDMAYCGTFQYSVGGFEKQPTDYYFRTLGLQYEESELIPGPCDRGLAEARKMLRWTKDFLTVFPTEPVFVLTFISYLSHDSLGTVHFYDDLVLDFFKHLNEQHHLNRSLVFFMGDHGYRFGEGRSTLVGREESKLPFLFVLYPRWFSSERPEFVANLKVNAHRLTTVLDVHETLMDILRLPRAKDRTNASSSPSNGTSGARVGLFSNTVSSKRTCAEALIPQKFCACSESRELPLKNAQVQRVARKLVAAVNNFTVTHRSLCRPLRLFNVTYASVQTVDDVGERTLHYQLIVETFPGLGMFEGMVLYVSQGNTYVIHREEVERINRYDHQADCLSDGSLKPFCYCREQPKS